MFLSNRPALLLTLLAAVAASGCSRPGDTGGAPPATPAIEPPRSAVPFEAREPEIFHADLVTITGGVESRSRYARKGTNWRFDTFDGETPSRSIIGTDKRTHLDHRAKTYAEAPSGGGPAERPEFVRDLTQNLLNRRDRAKYERLPSDGPLELYRVTVERSVSPFIVTYDPALRMVTRQAPETPTPGGFVFELRAVNLEVSDDLFRIPPGYRKVPWPEFAR